MKHLHLLMVVITIGLFLYQAGLIFAGGQVTPSRTFKIYQPNPKYATIPLWHTQMILDNKY
ncbi:hypothetical protein [Moraxella equi]|uniref:Uncharacterized protein n=1 Tax=Moraxella equi TaxID=60442 RepID=A0A378QPW8_9GAMM|nr:hypothetical protein [Moraxella equi]STZ02915.1 Uncharacterised protein [Moraxella equi]